MVPYLGKFSSNIKRLKFVYIWRTKIMVPSIVVYIKSNSDYSIFPSTFSCKIKCMILIC